MDDSQTPSEALPFELEGSVPTMLPEMPKECATECSTSIFGLADAQTQTSSFSSEVVEERWVCNSVISIHAKDEEQYSSETVSSAFVLLDSVPNSLPIPI